MDIRRFAAAAFAVLAGTAAFAQAGTQRITVGFNSRGFWGAYASWEYCVDDRARAGVFIDTSALMLLRGEFDAGEIGACAHWETGVGDSYRAEFGVEAGYRFQGQALGFAQSAFSRQSARLSRPFDSLRPGIDVGWDQTWLTRVRLGDRPRDAFEDRYEGCPAAPSSVTVPFPSTRFRVGPSLGVRMPGDSGLSIGAGLQWTPNPYVSGFDGMMFGHFPFYADVGISFPVSGFGASE